MVSNPFGSPLTVEVNAETSGLESGLSGAMNKLNSFEGAVGAAGAALAGLSAKGIAKTVSAAGDLDAALTESQAIMGELTNKQMKGMEEAAREVGRTTTFSADEAGSAFYYLASAGMDAEQSMAAIGDVAQFAQAGAFDLATATDLSTDALTSLGMAAEDPEENLENLNRVQDNFVRANELANASVEQYAEAMTNKLGPAMRASGMEIEEGTAALAVFADAGLKGKRAGTILTRTIEGLQDGARNNADAFEELGIQVFNAEGEMRPLQAIVADAEDAFSGMSTEQRAAAMEQLGFNQRSRQGMEILLGQSDALGEYQTELESAGGATQRVAEKQLESFNNQVELLKSQFADIAIEIGTVFLPILERLVGAFSVVVEWFAEINSRSNGMVGAITLLTGLFSGLAMMGWSVVSMLGGLGPTLALVKTAAVGLALPFIKIIAVIGTIIAVTAALHQAWVADFAGIRTQTMRVVNAVRDHLGPVIDRTSSLISTIIGDLSSVFGGFGGSVEGAIGRVVTAVADWLIGAIEIAFTVINNWLTSAHLWWMVHGDAVIAAVDRIVSTVEEWLVAGIQAAFDVVNAILARARAWWAQHGDTVISVASRIANLLGSILIGTITWVFQRTMAWLQTGQQLWAEHGDAVIAAVGRLVDELTKWGNIVLGLLSVALNKLIGFLEWLLPIIGRVVNRLSSAMIPIIRTLGSAILQAIPLAIDAFILFSQAVRQAITIVWQNVLQPFIAWFVPIWTETMGPIVEEASKTWSVWSQILVYTINTVRENIGAFLEWLAPYWNAYWEDFNANFQVFMADMRAIWDLVGDDLIATAQFVWDLIASIVRGSLTIISGILQTIMAVARTDWSTAWDIIKQTVVDVVSGIGAFVLKWGERFVYRIGEITLGVIDWFVKLGQRLIWGSLIPDMLTAIHNAFVNYLTSVLNFVKQTFNNILTFITTQFTATKNFLVSTLTNIYQFFVNQFTLLKNLVSDIWAALNSDTKSVWGAIKTYLSGTLSNIQQFFNRQFTAIKNFVSQTLSNIYQLVRNQMSSVKQFFTATLGKIVSRIKTWASNARDAWWNGLDRMHRALGKAGQQFKRRMASIVSGVVQKVKDAGSKMYNAGKNLIQSIVNGVKAKPNAVKNAVASHVGEAAKFLPWSDAEEGPLSNLSESGPGLVQTVAQGIRAESGRMAAAVAEMAAGARVFLPGSDAATGPLSDLQASGHSFGSTFAQGIRSSEGEVAAAANSLAQTAREPLNQGKIQAEDGSWVDADFYGGGGAGSGGGSGTTLDEIVDKHGELDWAAFEEALQHFDSQEVDELAQAIAAVEGDPGASNRSLSESEARELIKQAKESGKVSQALYDYIGTGRTHDVLTQAVKENTKQTNSASSKLSSAVGNMPDPSTWARPGGSTGDIMPSFGGGGGSIGGGPGKPGMVQAEDGSWVPASFYSGGGGGGSGLSSSIGTAADKIGNVSRKASNMSSSVGSATRSASNLSGSAGRAASNLSSTSGEVRELQKGIADVRSRLGRYDDQTKRASTSVASLSKNANRAASSLSSAADVSAADLDTEDGVDTLRRALGSLAGSQRNELASVLEESGFAEESFIASSRLRSFSTGAEDQELVDELRSGGASHEKLKRLLEKETPDGPMTQAEDGSWVPLSYFGRDSPSGDEVTLSLKEIQSGELSSQIQSALSDDETEVLPTGEFGQIIDRAQDILRTGRDAILSSDFRMESLRNLADRLGKTGLESKRDESVIDFFEGLASWDRWEGLDAEGIRELTRQQRQQRSQEPKRSSGAPRDTISILGGVSKKMDKLTSPADGGVGGPSPRQNQPRNQAPISKHFDSLAQSNRQAIQRLEGEMAQRLDTLITHAKNSEGVVRIDGKKAGEVIEGSMHRKRYSTEIHE